MSVSLIVAVVEFDDFLDSVDGNVNSGVPAPAGKGFGLQNRVDNGFFGRGDSG